jgi:hypothetical protein
MTITHVHCWRCGTQAAVRRHVAPRCPGCGIYLVRDEPTGEWVTHAELERRHRQAHDAPVIEATRQLAFDALPAVQAHVPDHWQATVDPPSSGATWALTIHPAAGPIDVHAYLTPPHSNRGWYVRIHNRTEKVGFPLYTAGGAHAAQFGTLPDAVDAALTALLTETGKPGSSR